MLRGLYTSALGMTTQMNRMDVISNNIANVNTGGYKKDKVITQSFTEELMKHITDDTGEANMLKFNNTSPVGKFSLGLFVDDMSTDFSTGPLKTTNGTFDLAVNGSGFFAVNYTNPNGQSEERYTRDGAFTLSGDRTLMTKDGVPVAGVNGGNITVPDGSIAIGEDGAIYVDAEYVNQIRLVDFNDKTFLRKQGGNLYNAPAEAGLTAFTGTVEQGVLELSNVNSVREMVEMIEITRAYEANQRMITTHDQTMQRAVNDIGKK